MAQSFTLSLPEDFITNIVRQEVKKQIADYLAKNPPGDQQYSVATVAAILDVKEETVRGYFGLPNNHPRQLPYVEMTGSARGRRVRTSDLLAWQLRNVSSSFSLERAVMRTARRRP